MQIVRSLHQNEQIIFKCLDNWRRVYLLMGETFLAIKEGEQWRQTEAATWHEYCEKSWGFKHSQVSNFIGVHKEFGKEIEENPEFKNIKMSRLVTVIPLVTPSNKMEVLHAAANIPDSKGWENTVRNLRNKVGTDDPHDHQWIPINLEQCSICNLKRKVTTCL